MEVVNLEFKTKKDINKFLNDNGIFLRQLNGGYKLFIKHSDNPESCLELREEQERRLVRFITSNTSNPYIDFNNDTNNIRIYATEIDYDILRNYQKENNSISKIKQLHDELQNWDYVYCIREDNFYKINNGNEKGLFLTDKKLISENDKVLSSKYHLEYLEKAAGFTGKSNEFEEKCFVEIDKFNKINISDFERI